MLPNYPGAHEYNSMEMSYNFHLIKLEKPKSEELRVVKNVLNEDS